MERKTLQLDLNTHTRLIKHCKEKKYNVAGWAAKVINDAIYLEKYGTPPIERISKLIKKKASK